MHRGTSGMVTVAFGLLMLGLGWTAGKRFGAAEQSVEASSPAIPAVTATEAKTVEFNPPSEYVGHVEPVQEVDVLPQIEGYVKKVRFVEGARVSAGDVLFEIDTEQYSAALNLKRSNVKSAEAQVKVAQAEVERAERYFRRLTEADDRGVTATDRDAAEMALASAKAALNSAVAQVDEAKASEAIAEFNMKHTLVHAPISGRIGKALRHVGDFVSPNKSAMARIVQLDPIRVVFPITDRDYDSWQSAAEKGGQALRDSRRLRLRMPDGSLYGTTGTIDFGDNEMSRETATLVMHVAFANPSGRLVPNAFVRVLSDELKPQRALTVPTLSLVRTDEGLQAWKIAADGRVHPVFVKVDGEWNGLSRIAGGLSEGDRIVAAGAFKLNDGDAVKVVEK